jgi:hypothetical protein
MFNALFWPGLRPSSRAGLPDRQLYQRAFAPIQPRKTSCCRAPKPEDWSAIDRGSAGSTRCLPALMRTSRHNPELQQHADRLCLGALGPHHFHRSNGSWNKSDTIVRLSRNLRLPPRRTLMRGLTRQTPAQSGSRASRACQRRVDNRDRLLPDTRLYRSEAERPAQLLGRQQ